MLVTVEVDVFAIMREKRVDFQSALAKKFKIDAIKLMRECTDCSLVEGKVMVEYLMLSPEGKEAIKRVVAAFRDAEYRHPTNPFEKNS